MDRPIKILFFTANPKDTSQLRLDEEIRGIKTAFDLGCLQIDLENLNEQDTPKLLAMNDDPKEILFVRANKRGVVKNDTEIIDKKSVQQYKTIPEIVLRSQPLSTLSLKDVEKILKENDFFDGDFNTKGKGLQHKYELFDRVGEKLVIDHMTGLMWQQSGSDVYMSFSKAKQHIQFLNRKNFAGYNDWRLPTVEEAMSLVESEKKNGNLHIDSVFDQKQEWIWTADESVTGQVWGVSFYYKGCDLRPMGDDDGYVRAVR